MSFLVDVSNSTELFKYRDLTNPKFLIESSNGYQIKTIGGTYLSCDNIMKYKLMISKGYNFVDIIRKEPIENEEFTITLTDGETILTTMITRQFKIRIMDDDFKIIICDDIITMCMMSNMKAELISTQEDFVLTLDTTLPTASWCGYEHIKGFIRTINGIDNEYEYNGNSTSIIQYESDCDCSDCQSDSDSDYEDVPVESEPENDDDEPCIIE